MKYPIPKIFVGWLHSRNSVVMRLPRACGKSVIPEIK